MEASCVEEVVRVQEFITLSWWPTAGGERRCFTWLLDSGSACRWEGWRPSSGGGRGWTILSHTCDKETDRRDSHVFFWTSQKSQGPVTSLFWIVSDQWRAYNVEHNGNSRPPLLHSKKSESFPFNKADHRYCDKSILLSLNCLFYYINPSLPTPLILLIQKMLSYFSLFISTCRSKPSLGKLWGLVTFH